MRLAARNPMPEIFVNDVLQTLDQIPETWGELLEALDAKAARDGVVLSAARFDGVEESAFREPIVTGRALTGLRRVDVETTDERAFLRSCLLDAVQPLQSAAITAQSLAEHYRRSEIARGHQGLTALATDLRSLAILVMTVSGPLGVDLSAAVGGGSVDAHIGQLVGVLDGLLSAQASEDWVTVADILEYDLEPAIRRWATALASVAEGLS